MGPLGAYTRLIKATQIGAAVAFAKLNGFGSDLRPIYLDVGARGGLSKPWHVLSRLNLIKPVFVEPDPFEAHVLTRKYPEATIITHALGAANETRHLHLTKERGRSSLLEPDYEFVSQFNSDPWMIEETVEIETVRLDSVWATHAQSPPHYVKLDVQGFEKEVLIGMGCILDGVMCVAFETSFVPFYRGQPCFHEMLEFLRSRGFDLVKLKPVGLYNNSILEFDAFMVQKDCHQEVAVQLWKKVNDVGSHERIVARGF